MTHPIVFTGHMIDKNDREKSRFPASKEMAVKVELQKQLVINKGTSEKLFSGIAGGACGGDILFHELCEELNIASELYLALPVAEFKQKSVSYAGKSWENRFDRLINKLPFHILPAQKRNNSKDNVWATTNLWMLNQAFMIGGANTTLIALWDGKKGDGNGGTEQMINSAKKKGAKINIININKI